MPPKIARSTPVLDPPAGSRREMQNNLHDILMIVLCAVLSGMEDRVGVEESLSRTKKLSKN